MPRARMDTPRKPEPDPRRYVALAPKAPEGPIVLDALWPVREGEIELEIGFGRGMFLLERAAAAPDARLLGIEIKRKWSYLVEQRAAKLGLTKVRVFGADARDVMARLEPAGAITRVFMHFPDPWWKKRHAKRRLRGAETLDPIARLLAPGGQLYLQTDVEERAETFVADLREHPDFALPEAPASPYLEVNPFGARSNREKRAIEDGLPVFRILATRR